MRGKVTLWRFSNLCCKLVVYILLITTLPGCKKEPQEQVFELKEVSVFNVPEQLYWDFCRGQDSLRMALERLAGEIRRSSRDRIAVDNADGDRDAITLQEPVRFTGVSTLWGADGEVGNYLFYYVDGDGDLMRATLDSDMEFTGKRTLLARGVDEARDGEKGLGVVQDGDTFTLRLRLVMRTDGTLWTREYSTAVAVRN